MLFFAMLGVGFGIAAIVFRCLEGRGKRDISKSDVTNNEGVDS